MNGIRRKAGNSSPEIQRRARQPQQEKSIEIVGDGNSPFEYIALDALKPNPNNPRKHPHAQMRAMKRSIDVFGFTAPILIDVDNRVLAGHARLEAAKALGLSAVPTIRLKHLTPTQARAYVLADNKLTDLSSWDEGKLTIELKELTEMALDFSIEATGFEQPEIDFRIQSAQPDDLDAADEFESVEGLPVTLPGETWTLGPHRIHCGSALHQQAYQALLGDETASAVFTDPPYNVKIQGNVRGKGTRRHSEFKMASGEMSAEEFKQFLCDSLELAAAYLAHGGLVYSCMDWRHIEPLLAAGRHNAFELLNLCVWVKSNGGMGSLYRSRHELVFVFRHGKAPHINNVQLGRFGRNRNNVWHYTGANSFARGKSDDDFDTHPTVKPVRLVADALLDCTNRGDIVLDPFLGSGTTILSAERTGRRGYGIELDPLHVDTAVRRWQELTRQAAVNQDGQTFAEAQSTRGKP